MIIAGDPRFDFQGSELIKFAQSAATGAQLDVQKTQQIGFHPVMVPAIEMGELPMVKGMPIVPWTLLQQWAIDEIGRSGPQRIQTFGIETTAWRELGVMVCVELMVRDGVDPEIEESMCDAFTAYRYPGSGELDAYIENCLKALPGVSPYAFELVFFYRVRLLNDRQVDDTHLQRVQAGLTERYRLQMISESALDNLRPDPPHPNLKEEVDSSTAVEEVARENQPRAGCDGLITDFKEFARADILPQSRTTWGWHNVKIGCAIFDLYYPTTEFRDQELVASVYWTHPGPLDQYVKKIVEDCARDSAMASVVILIVFTDLTTAIASFKALFWQCLRDKLQQTLSCLDVGVVVNTVPKGDWH